jgi:23S rRNA (uracil1939-C5)-methyltransferase
MAGGPRIGDEFEADVRDLTSAGLGVVAHPSGRVFFARGVWPGERGTFAITALKGRAGEAALIELLERSPARATPACVHHGVTADACGGCPWQFVSYDAQLVAKQQRIEKHLAPLLAPGSVAPIWPSPEELGYRNRAQLKSDGQRLGYLAAASRNIVDVDDCPILNEHNRGTLRALRAELPKRAWRPRRGRDWTTIDIDDDVDAQGAGVNRRRPFRQGNSAQNERMRQWLADTVSSLGAVGQVLELYAGSGNFTDVLAALPSPRWKALRQRSMH